MTSKNSTEPPEDEGVLDELLSDLPGVVYRCRNDRSWTMLGLSENVEDLTGYAPSDLVGNATLPFAELIHPDDRERVWTGVQEALERDETFRVVYRIRTRGGGERWVLEQGRAVGEGKGAGEGKPGEAGEAEEGEGGEAGETEDDGAFEGEPGGGGEGQDDHEVLTGYIQDIAGPLARRLTESRGEVEAVRRQAGHLELLQSVTAIVNRERRLEEALEAALPEICQMLDFSVGHVFLGEAWDPEEEPRVETPAGGGLISTDTWLLDEDVEGLELFREATERGEWNLDEDLPGRVMSSGDAEWVEDVKGDPGFLRVGPADGCPVRSGVGFPVMSEETTLAVVEVYSHRAMEDDVELRKLLEQIGVQLGRVWEREEASRERNVAERRFRQLAENVEAVLWLSTVEGRILYLSPGFGKLTGGREPISHWRELLEIAHPGDRDRMEKLLAEDGRAPYEIEYRILVEGEVRWIHQKAFPVRDGQGEVPRVGGLAEDVTDRRRAREELEETTRFLESTISSIAEGVLVIDTSGDGRKIVEANQAVEDMFGYSRGELVGETTEKLHVSRESFERFGREGDPVLEEEGVFRASYPMKRRDGTVFQAEQTVTLLDPDEGLPGGAVSVIRDVSERTRTRVRLRESEERFRQIAETIDDVFWIRSPDLERVEYVSPAYEALVGQPVEELYENPLDWLDHVHSEDRERVLAAIERSAVDSFEEEYRVLREDGEIRWVWDRAFPVRNHRGEVYRVIGVAEDVTERKELETQLLRSQKMEAVGRLAGGVAHDFNNLLTVIRAHTDFLLLDLATDSPLVKEVENIRDAADRAARLTSQLLAFSRDQVLRPRVVDLNEIVVGMEKLLARILGEDVRIETEPAPELLPIRVDPGQLEQVVMNLAVNARDAMPEGGTLRLATAEEEVDEETAASSPGLEPGRHVRLTVADTGTGMDRETVDRIFEPFFTTKPGREGTGLGLATSYGIVKQSGGSIHVESEPGEGTTFVLRFPPAEGTPDETDSPRTEILEKNHVTGTVLVVEDDSAVSRAARRILERAGLDVRTAADAETGLAVLEAGDVDLLLTDLVLPDMGGSELTERARKRFPDLPVVAMSGYAEGSPGSRRDLPPEIAFVQKPFSAESLVETVREQLAEE